MPGIMINLLHLQLPFFHQCLIFHILQPNNHPNHRSSDHPTESCCNRRPSTRTPSSSLRTRSRNLQPIPRRHNRSPIHRRSRNSSSSRLRRATRPRGPRRFGTPRPSSPARPVGRRTCGLTPPSGPGLGAPVGARGPLGPGAVVGWAEGAGTAGAYWVHISIWK
jgi:hypothetical protein